MALTVLVKVTKARGWWHGCGDVIRAWLDLCIGIQVAASRIRARHLEAQAEQAWCLTLIANALAAWTTEYYGLAVDAMRAAGRRVDDEVCAHLPSAQREPQLLRCD
ncbi:hypothetical protein ACG83_40445 [Frankia sp. R43]|nr:hypothetical protein ACG83_40445 [Frankia sp. R43]